MEPDRDMKVTLVDLLDRILEKGVVLNADLIIALAGIPLIGINLRAAIASVDTMLRYGIWDEWDAAQRVLAREERGRRTNEKLPLVEGEEVRLKMFGSYWYSDGLYRTWRLGYIYLTDRRVLYLGKELPEILFEAYYEELYAFALEQRENLARRRTDYLYLFLRSGTTVQLHPVEAYSLKEAIERRMNERGLHFESRAVPMRAEIGEL